MHNHKKKQVASPAPTILRGATPEPSGESQMQTAPRNFFAAKHQASLNILPL